MSSLYAPGNGNLFLSATELAVYTGRQARLMLMSCLSGYTSVHTHDHLLFLALNLVDRLLQVLPLLDHHSNLAHNISSNPFNRSPLLLAVR